MTYPTHLPPSAGAREEDSHQPAHQVSTGAVGLLMDETSCACWTHNSALGHGGHCCFLRDDRTSLRRAEAWRELGDVCHVLVRGNR